MQFTQIQHTLEPIFRFISERTIIKNKNLHLFVKSFIYIICIWNNALPLEHWARDYGKENFFFHFCSVFTGDFTLRLIASEQLSLMIRHENVPVIKKSYRCNTVTVTVVNILLLHLILIKTTENNKDWRLKTPDTQKLLKIDISKK